MSEVVPLTITARNRAQAEYLVRSRAQQRGVSVAVVDAVPSGADQWFLTVTVDDADTARVLAAALDEDTQVFHLRNHPPHRRIDED